MTPDPTGGQTETLSDESQPTDGVIRLVTCFFNMYDRDSLCLNYVFQSYTYKFTLS